MLALCVNRFIYGQLRFIWFVLGKMFFVFFIIDLTYIGCEYDVYKASNCIEQPYYVLPILFVVLLIAVILYKRWVN
jgi:hypothetical protein